RSMLIRWLFAAVHLVALGIGLGAVWTRARLLRGTLERADLQRVFAVDIWWGVAALLWVATGLTRVFASMEKSTTYYLHNHIFWTKMAVFLLVIVLEFRAARTLAGWRRQVSRGGMPDTSAAAGLARISTFEAALVVVMVLLATAMARGYGA
ncbi:MAG: DUF2214 family protein, partial [Gemmatimonadaceae bacterium]